MHTRFTNRHPYLSRHLSDDGSATGEKNARVDGSGTPQVFKISPPVEGVIILARMLVEVRDAGAFRADTYGAIERLTNGVQVGMVNDSTGVVEEDFTDGLSIQDDAGWGRMCHDVQLLEWGAGDKFISARWTFGQAGTLIMLRPDGPAFGIIVNDDLTDLVSHFFLVQGWSE